MNITARVETESPLTLTEGNIVRAAAAKINAVAGSLDTVEKFLDGIRLAMNADSGSAPWLVYRGGSHVALIKDDERILFAVESTPRPDVATDECPKCSRVGGGPLCKAHQTAPQAPQATTAPRKRSKAQGPRDLTSDELQALQVFASTHGRNWKQTLRDGWMVAAYPGDLQVIRNTFGPSWLTTFRLPKAVR